MKILGINDGFCATAALLEDGRVTRMIAEERFTRKKNDSGFPARSVAWLFDHTGYTANDLDAIAFASRGPTISAEQPLRTARHRVFAAAARILPGVVASDWFITAGVEWMARRREKRLEWPSLRRLGCQELPRSFYDHHLTHAAAAYYGSGFRQHHDRALIVTYDGSGDGQCSTIHLVEDGRFQPLHTINSYHSLALLYTRVTQYLGMKPLEHEYKLMGMAPYSDTARARAVRDKLQAYVRLTADGLSTENVSRTWGDSMLAKLYRDLRGERFDWVAGGMQLHFEESMLTWLENWIRKTGVHNLVVGGGAFMNVKLNMLLSQSDLVEDLFVMPSCGDDSIALGAAYLQHERLAPGTSHPIRELYLGYTCSEAEIQTVLDRYKSQIDYRKCDDIERESARLLADGKIIGRCRGPMEWGARALGNRSILANPSKMSVIHRINRAIKMRDFWMPFCPSILYERRQDYLVNPSDLDASYMIVAFPSTPLAGQHLIAGLHPFDQTARPQLVTKAANPRYHYLLTEFEKATGIGAVLNTSFNLHGEPIVCTAEDCLHTLTHSQIDYLALEDYLVWRQDA